MKKTTSIISAITLQIFAFAFLAGSLVHAQTETTDLNDLIYFNKSVSKIEQLQQTEEKTIADTKHESQILSHGKKTKYVVLSLPGLHESPFHLKSLNEFFFNEGANVLSLHLPGHQQKNESALNKVKAKEWEKAVADTIVMAHGLGEKLIILGYSTGGGLAVQAALQHPEEINQLFLFAPALALSNATFISTFLGQTASGVKLCDMNKPGLLCAIFNKLDPQTTQLMKEGVYPSAAAGTEVQKLINDMRSQFANSEINDYFGELEDAYAKLKVPTFLVSSMADTVTNPKFNRIIYSNWTMRKQMVEYPAQLKVTHLMITKAKTDAFPHSVEETYNHYFEELLPQMKAFWMSDDR